MRDRFTPLACGIVLALVIAGARAARAQEVTVFAAASLKNALDEVDRAFREKTGMKVVASYAASSALIKQIENGAPADVFASAAVDWMGYGPQHKLIKRNPGPDLPCSPLGLIPP